MGQRQCFDVPRRETTVLVSLPLELPTTREFQGQKSSLELFLRKTYRIFQSKVIFSNEVAVCHSFYFQVIPKANSSNDIL